MAGWWRRNGWAVPVCVLALAAASVPDVREAYDTYRRVNAFEPVRPGADGWVRYGTGAVRIDRIEQISPVDFDGKPVPVPPGTRTWRATFRFELPDPEAFSGCTTDARSDQGNLFSEGGAELLKADDRSDAIGCSPKGDKLEGPQKFTGSALYLLPEGERPVAVQLSLRTQFPRYAELPVAG
jgi:hypothetical protein